MLLCQFSRCSLEGLPLPGTLLGGAGLPADTEETLVLWELIQKWGKWVISMRVDRIVSGLGGFNEENKTK